MAHLKRQHVSKNWPISRKGTAYVVTPASDASKGVPALIALRDMIKIAQNRKEVKKAIFEKSILLNKKILTDEKTGITLFDVITIVPSKEHYQLTLATGTGKFEFVKVKEAKDKVAKVTNKTILKGKKIQINLGDGNNYLSNMACKTNDSVIVDFDKKQIIKCLPLKEKANVIVFSGKHAGDKGSITNIVDKMVQLNIAGKDINVLIKQIIVTE